MAMIATNGLPFTPSVEPTILKTTVLSQDPHEALKQGLFNKVPIMAGVTSLELLSFQPAMFILKPIMGLVDISPSLYVRMTKDFRKWRIILQSIKRRFLQGRNIIDANDDDIYKMLTEDMFWRPIIKTAQLLSKHVPVYFYQFSYIGDMGDRLIDFLSGSNELKRQTNGSVHGEDLVYLFYMAGVAPKSDKDLKMCLKMTKLYTNFAKTGNPTPFSDPFLDGAIWQKISNKNVSYTDLGDTFSHYNDDFNAENTRYWDALYKKYADKHIRVY